MQKIKDIKLTAGANSVRLEVDWDRAFVFNNKEKARRAATKLNKHYTDQIEQLNATYTQLLSIWRTYWLFLSPFDGGALKQRIIEVADILDHALAYQTEYYNTPADISRAAHAMAGVCDSLELIATKRKDIPLQHQLRIIKTRIVDDYERNPRINQGQNSRKRPALRKAAGAV